MGQDIECAYLCDRVVNGHDVKWAQELIEDSYITEWILDNLPGATSFVTVDRKRKYYAAGFKLGYKDYDMVTGKKDFYINNHFTMVVRWRKAPGSAGDHGGKVVTGFEVYTKSLDRGQRNATGCPANIDEEVEQPFSLRLSPNNTDLAEQYSDSSYIPPATVDLDQVSMTIPYTYSVYFREEHNVEWANRWDLYFEDQAESTSTHWLAIVNSIIISSILGAVCMVIWIRTTSGETRGYGDGIHEDAKIKPRKRVEKKLANYEKEGGQLFEEEPLDEEALDDVVGWKLLHADVFRPPMFAGLLAPIVGSGLQLVTMISGLLSLSCLGVLNPSWRGGFITVGLFIFFFAGGLSGYLSARLYKTFGGQNYRKNTLMVRHSPMSPSNVPD